MSWRIYRAVEKEGLHNMISRSEEISRKTDLERKQEELEHIELEIQLEKAKQELKELKRMGHRRKKRRLT